MVRPQPSQSSAAADTPLQARLAELEQQLQQCQAELQQTRLAQQQADRHFQRILNNTLAAVTCLRVYPDHTWEYEYRSTGYEAVFGYKPEDFQDPSFWMSRVYSGEWERYLLPTLDHMTAGGSGTVEYRFYHKDGSLRWISDTYASIWDEANLAWVATIVSTDVTDRKRTEEALRHQQRFATQMAESTSALLYIYDLSKQRNVYVNSQIHNLLGYSPEYIQSLGNALFPTLLHPADRPIIATSAQRYLSAQDGELIETEYRMRHANGEWRWLYSRDSVFTRTEDGIPKQIMGTAVDITQLKQAEALLRQREQEFRTLVEKVPDLIARLDRDCRFLYVNPRLEEAFRLPATAIVGRTNADLGVPAPMAQLWQQQVEQAFTSGEEQQFEYSCSFTEHPQYWFARIVPEKAADGTIDSALVIIQDVTKNKQSEQAVQAINQQLEKRIQERTIALQQSEALFRQLFEEAPIGIASARTDNYRIFQANRCFCEMVGYTLEELAELTFVELTHPDDVAAENQLIEQMIANHLPGYQMEKRYVRKNGEVFWGFLTITTVYNPIENVWLGLGMVQDISERKRIESERQQAEQQQQQQAEAAHLLAAVAQAINQSIRLEEVLQESLERVRQFLQADRVMVCRFDSDWCLSLEMEAVSQPTYSLKRQQQITTCSHHDLITQYQQGQIAVYQDVQAEAQTTEKAELLTHLQIRACVVAPIHKADQLWGLLVVHQCNHARLWQPFEVSLIQQLATQIGIASQKEDLYTQIERELKQKETLLKEVHHRVKNNMQMISSLLNLQASSIRDEAALLPFIESQQRIKTMALIHEKLYQSENLIKINFAEYAQQLLQGLFASHTIPSSLLQLRTEVANLELDVDTAVPCGLIINELVSNAIKYAFSSAQAGKIEVYFSLHSLTEGAEHYILSVSDNGMGLPAHIDFHNTASLGFQLVSALTQKLQGTITVDCTEGTRFEISFPT